MNQLIEFLITSSVLILLVIIIRVCFMGKVKNSVIYALWLVVLVRLLCPFNFFSSSFSVMNGVELMQSSINKTADRNNTNIEYVNDTPKRNNSEKSNIGGTDLNTNNINISENNISKKENQSNNVEDKVSEVEKNADMKNAPQINISPITIITIVWGIGVLVCLSIIIVFNVRFRRKLNKDRSILDGYSKGKCKVYKTSKVSTPCLYGVFTPGIYIPEVILHKLSDGDIEQILEHESRHYIHKDHVWSFVRCMMVSIYWFHPLVWVAAKLSKKDAELFCDESILAGKSDEERIQYGEMLLNVARVCKKIPMIYPITAVHSGKKEMKKRIIFIGKARKYYKIVFFALAAILMIGSVATFTACKTEQNDKTEQKSKTDEYVVVDFVTDVNGYNITIPQVDKLDAETKDYINETINSRIEDKVKELYEEGSFYYFEYSIESKTEELLSILIQYDYMGEKAAHPFVNAFAINIDIKNKTEIYKEDVINYEKIRYALKNNYLKKVVKNNHGIEGDSVLNNEDILDAFSDVENDQFYISSDKVGLIFELTYAQGNYEIFETEDMRTGDYGVIQYTNAWSDLELTYKGTFMCGEEEMYSEKTNMSLWCFEYTEDGITPGTLYELELYGTEGRHLGYVYFTGDKIYKFNDIENFENNKVPEDAYVVCQMEDMKDSLGENEKGWHQYIEVKGDTIEYHSYNNQVETGYYETIIWKKNVGITFYQSGYGAGRDEIKLEIEEGNDLIEKYNSKMRSYTKETLADVIEEDFDGDGEEEAFVLVNFVENDEEEYDNSFGCELWYVDGDNIKKATSEKNCYSGSIQMISVGEEKHIILNAENARLGDGSRAAIYGVNDGELQILFEQNYLNLYASDDGLIAHEGDYFHYDSEVEGWMGYCSLPYNFYWNETEGRYEEYIAEEISEDEFLGYSGAKSILDKVINYCSDIHYDRDKITKVEKEYLKRENDTIDINLILNYNTGERMKYFSTVRIYGNSIEQNREMILEGNKKISLLEELN